MVPLVGHPDRGVLGPRIVALVILYATSPELGLVGTFTATFSIDGVLGAFAFTFSLPLILLGNGLGAIAVRQITVSNIARVKKYKYLKNGAMYSIFFLGAFMMAEAFGAHIPSWASPLITVVVLAYFFWKSAKEIEVLAQPTESSH